MLEWDPDTRINATDALAHPYLDEFHDLGDEPSALDPFDWSFTEIDISVDEWKLRIKNVNVPDCRL
jgi:p38 MAP kinase